MKRQFLSLLIIIMVFVTIAYGAKSNISAPKNVKIFVIDEGQLVREIGRGVKFELLLSRLKMRYPEAVRPRMRSVRA